MDVRERVLRGQSVRVRPLADESGTAVSSIYAWIARGKIEAIKFENVVLVTPKGARPLLGISEPIESEDKPGEPVEVA